MKNLILRYRDVLLALSIANKYNIQLGKLQLQKYIYLSDVLSILWEIISVNEGYETYRHGPYDYDIQNAVDILAFRGFVRITDYEILQDGGIRAKYIITNLGEKLIKEICKHDSFKARYYIYNEIGKQINIRGWSKLRQIVYAEPTYVNQSVYGWNTKISTNNFTSNLSMHIIWSFKKLSEVFEKNLNRENLVALYFQVLDEYIENKAPYFIEDGD